MKFRDFNLNFKKRTFSYLLIGIICTLIDFQSFSFLTQYLKPTISNPISYSLGSLISYILNREITFQSRNSRFSFKRYLVIIFLGFITSQIIIWFGINRLDLKSHIRLIKIISIFTSALLQYIGNTYFSNKLR